ncbi:MAG: peptidylprolyl isomerase [Alphaproteobacteria bacterium]|nr:peptidylprolyl isomerase [Alphaproteobacteria bacterium]
MLAKSIGAAFGLLAFCSATLAQDQAADDNPVVAIVNGTEIHRADVETIAHSLPEQMRQMPMAQIYPMLLDRVIDFKLLSVEAENQNLGDDPDLQPALAEARANVLRDAMLRRKVEEGSTEDALMARYEELKKGDGFAYEEVHARHILLASEDDAKAVISELEGGADFEALAKDKSTGPSGPQGGDLGYFKKGQMVAEFGDAAFAMEIGSTSAEPVKTQFGFHVIKVEDKRKVEPSFEETEPQLRQEVAREIVTALVETLRGGAEIERFNMDGSPMEMEEGEAGGDG